MEIYIQHHHHQQNEKNGKKLLYAGLKKYLWIFPLYCSFGLLVISTVPYFCSVHYGYTDAIFPFVSDSAGYPPGASIFASVLSLGSIFALISSWIRYKQTKYYLRLLWKNSTNNNRKLLLKRLMIINFQTIPVMIVAMFGIMITSTFRSTELPILTIIHTIGATIAITFQILYFLLIIIIAWKLNNCFNDNIETLPISLTILLILKLISLIIFIYNFVLIWLQNGKKFFDPKLRTSWIDHNNRHNYLLATINETFILILISISWLSLARRIRRFYHWNEIRF